MTYASIIKQDRPQQISTQSSGGWERFGKTIEIRIITDYIDGDWAEGKSPENIPAVLFTHTFVRFLSARKYGTDREGPTSENKTYRT